MAARNPANPPSDARRASSHADRGEGGPTPIGEIASRLYPKAPELTQRRPDAPAPADNTRSLVDHATAVTGKIATESDVTIEGALDGELECHGRVYIADGAKVGARLHAREVVVAGELKGDAVCTERLEAQPTARITGMIRTPILVVHEGALVDGTIIMSPPSSKAEESAPSTSPSEGEPEPEPQLVGGAAG